MGNAALDAEQYRLGYPDRAPDPPLDVQRDNLAFHLNKIRCEPDGDFLDNIHTEWWGQYRLLEMHHGYIQWIFPIREQGLNSIARPLTIHEAAAIQRSRAATKRVLHSLHMMLDFYGFVLVNEETGEVARAVHWQERFINLNTSFHNYLRITRIIKSLGELGLERLQAPLVWGFAREVFEHRELTAAEDSLCDYWIPVVKDDAERAQLADYVRQHRTELTDRRRPPDRQGGEDEEEEEHDSTSEDEQMGGVKGPTKAVATDVDINAPPAVPDDASPAPPPADQTENGACTAKPAEPAEPEPGFEDEMELSQQQSQQDE